MEEYVGSLIGRYRDEGVLVDTNLLLLYLVGAHDTRNIQRFRRTEQFDPDDFLQQFNRVVTTPHVLTETSNLLGQLSGRVRTECYALLRVGISRMQEHHTLAAAITAHPSYVQFGITDAAIAEAAPNAYLVLTEDLPLYGYLSNLGIDALNFNNIRPLEY